DGARPVRAEQPGLADLHRSRAVIIIRQGQAVIVDQQGRPLNVGRRQVSVMHEPKPRKRSSRNARFPRLISVSVPQRHADALEWPAVNSLLTASDHVRLALDQYLRDVAVSAQLAAATDRAMNGHAANGDATHMEERDVVR